MARLPDKPETPVDLGAVTFKSKTFEESAFAQNFKTGVTVADGALPSGATAAELQLRV